MSLDSLAEPIKWNDKAIEDCDREELLAAVRFMAAANYGLRDSRNIPVFYDIASDELRPITQADLDQAQSVIAAYGKISQIVKEHRISRLTENGVAEKIVLASVTRDEVDRAISLTPDF